MENILIAERLQTPLVPKEIQKVISVSYHAGTEYFYDYLDFDSYRGIYYGLDAAVDQFISTCNKEPVFSYRGIAFLQCFRLTLFYYLLNAELLQRTFRRLANARPEAHFFIEKNSFNSFVPFLSSILPVACPDFVSRVSVLEKGALGALPENPPRKRPLKETLWPLRVHCGSRNPKVLIYSDYYRASAVMKQLGDANCVYYTCYPEPRIFLASLACGFSFIQNVCSISDETAYRETMKLLHYEEIICPLIERLLDGFPQLRGAARQLFEHLFKTELPAVFFQIDHAHKVFESRPSLQSVLLDEDLSPFKNAICQTAMKLKKKCFVESHGALGDKYGYLPLTADRMFLWGRAQKEKLVRWGCAEDRLIVSGCSKYATYKAKSDATVRAQICRRYDFEPALRIVSFFPFPVTDSRSHNNKLIHERVHSILECLGFGGFQLIIKLHPAEKNKEFYAAWARERSSKMKAVVIQKSDPLLLAKASDLLIAHDSTMAVDGFAMGKPVIFFPLLPETIFSNNSVSEFESYGIFYRPRNAEDFQAVLKDLLKDPHRQPNAQDQSAARKDCLNECDQLPEKIISRELLGYSSSNGGGDR